MDIQFVFLSLCTLSVVLSANIDRQKRSLYGVNKYSTALSQSEVKFYLKELSELQDKLSGGKKSKSRDRGSKSSKRGGKKSRKSKNQASPWRAGMHWWETKHGSSSPSSSWSSSSSSPKCRQPLAYGNTDCTDHKVRYYYEKESKMCRKFHYTGCGGNQNKFNSESECKRKCKG